WKVTGNLKDWDVTARLGQLDLPVLVTSGRHDEMTPALVGPLVDGIRGAEWVVLEHSAHQATVEEPDRYRQVLRSWLGRVATPGPPSAPPAITPQLVRRSRVGRRGRCPGASGRGHRPVR